jgi:RNA polymerase sigma-54 factor
MDISIDMNVEQQMRVSPTLIAVNHILALSSQELQELIKQEAEENPAFEIIEHQTCSICGEQLKNGICVNCSRNATPESSPVNDAADEFGFGSLGYRDEPYSSNLSGGADDDDFDPVSLVASEPTVGERLMLDLRSTLAPEDFPVADYILGSLDDRGFLSCDVEVIADEVGIPVEDAERVLRVVQRTGPPGIGARDPRECLLLQLDYMKGESGEEPPNVREILTDYFVELGEHKYNLIAQRLGISLEEVEEAREFIKTNLTPYPVTNSAEDVATWGSPSKAQYVAPDVIIREVDGELNVEVVESRRFFMRLNPLYHQMAMDLRSKAGTFSEDDKKHIQQYVTRTKLFMSNIKQRRETMAKIANTLLLYQEDFLRHGVRHLKPLTRAQVAEATGLHESTVSRATAGKDIMLPSRQVVPFSDFFTASLSVKDIIKEIIDREGKPMADREIVARLRDRGIRIARRTVAKYRSQLGILPSTLR